MSTKWTVLAERYMNSFNLYMAKHGNKIDDNMPKTIRLCLVLRKNRRKEKVKKK